MSLKCWFSLIVVVDTVVNFLINFLTISLHTNNSILVVCSFGPLVIIGRNACFGLQQFSSAPIIPVGIPPFTRLTLTRSVALLFPGASR